MNEDRASAMDGIYCESTMTDLNVTEIRGVQYIVCSFFDGDAVIRDKVGALIQNTFETTDMHGITNDSLVDSGIAIPED